MGLVSVNIQRNYVMQNYMQRIYTTTCTSHADIIASQHVHKIK